MSKTRARNGGIRLLPCEYASFRKWVREFLQGAIRREDGRVMDPMAGTAPLIPFVEKNCQVGYFNDALPVHHHVNRAKTCDVYQALLAREDSSRDFLLHELLDCLGDLEGKCLLVCSTWIQEDLLMGLVHAWERTAHYQKPIRLLMRAIIILCVRPYSNWTGSGNTTWLKPGGISTGRDLKSVVEEAVERVRAFYEFHYSDGLQRRQSRCRLSYKDAADLSLKQPVDVIFTSPPYPNRFDPTRAYGPELYFLEAVGHRFKPGQVLGTTKVADYDACVEDTKFLSRVAPQTARFLNVIGDKAPEKESDYYLQYFARYYAGLYRVLRHLTMLLSAHGRMYVITQNNVHRGEVNTMAEFVCDFFQRQNWRAAIVEARPFPHQGLRNISGDYPLALKKHLECIVEAHR